MVPDQLAQESADLRDGERDEVLVGFCCPPFPALAARVTVRKACANIARVICRYQPS